MAQKNLKVLNLEAQTKKNRSGAIAHRAISVTLMLRQERLAPAVEKPFILFRWLVLVSLFGLDNFSYTHLSRFDV